MRGLSVLIATILLSCIHAFSQEADGTPVNGIGLSIIPRLDITPAFPYRDKDDLTLGNSSLYSLFEGSFLDGDLTFSLCNHWLSAWPSELYVCDEAEGRSANLFRSDYSNFLDWACITYETGGFSFTLGKDAMLMGGFEFDEDDYDIHPSLASSLWDLFPSNQWGAKAGYTLPSGNHSFAVQLTSSPYGERTFASGRFACSAEWRGRFGPYSTHWTGTILTRPEDKRIQPLLSFGQKVELGPWTFILDLFNSITTDDGDTRTWSLTALPSARLTVGDHFDFFLKGGYEGGKDDFGDWRGDWYGGGGVHWFPLADRTLRVHLTGAWRDDTVHRAFASLGVTYYFNLGILK